MKEKEKINKQNQENIKKNSVREDLDNIVKDIKDISKSKFEQKDIFWIAPTVVLLIGVLPMTIGYYTLSRVVVCGCSAYFAYNFYKKKNIPNIWIFVFFALLYNHILIFSRYFNVTIV